MKLRKADIDDGISSDDWRCVTFLTPVSSAMKPKGHWATVYGKVKLLT